MLKLNTQDESFLIRKENILSIESKITYDYIYTLSVEINLLDRKYYLEYTSNNKSFLNETKNKIMDDASDNNNKLENEMKELRNEIKELRNEIKEPTQLKSTTQNERTYPTKKHYPKSGV